MRIIVIGVRKKEFKISVSACLNLTQFETTNSTNQPFLRYTEK